MSSRRRLALGIGLVAIVAWQQLFFRNGDPDTVLQTPFKLTASNGVAEWQPEFVYFLYYLDLYPLVSLSNKPRVHSAEGARRLIQEEGGTLAMDRYWTTRYGELGKTYLYLPSAWARGRAARPRMLHANAISFTLALLLLYVSFWYVRKPALGALLVLLLGSNPFQVNEVYATNNLFGWPITITLLLLALHVPLLYGQAKSRFWLLALALTSGVILGTVRQIRTEPILVLFAVAAAYLAATHLRSWLRLAAVVVLGGAYLGFSSGWTFYFDAKFREAQRIVRAAGGHVYNGPRQTHHFFWHALWCGLGDFDQKYGHRWSDITAYSYAWSILQQRHVPDPSGYPPRAAGPTDVFSLAVYWDEGRQYPRTPFETPEYVELVRTKVLRDIVYDPAWYAGILARRMLRLFSESTPPSLALGNGWWVSLPGRAIWGYLGVAAALWLLWTRDWPSLKLALFPLPLAGTALFVYSGGGTPLYSIAHLVALAVVAPSVIPAAYGLLKSALVYRQPDQPPGSVFGATAWRELAARFGTRRAHHRVSGSGLAACRPLRTTIAGVVLLVLAPLVLVAAVRAARARIPTFDAPLANAPQLAILRFDNQTSEEGLAWIGEAIPRAIEGSMQGAGLRVLGPEEIDNLDADLIWWGPYGAPSVPSTLAMNVVADRSGAAHVLTGRTLSGPDGPRACARLWKASTRSAIGPERCEPVRRAGAGEAAHRLFKAVLSQLGDAGRLDSSEPLAGATRGSLEAEAEAVRAIQQQHFDQADRLLDDIARDHPQSSDARHLQARLRSRWQPLQAETLRASTGASDPAGALAALRAALSRSPDDTELRIELARVLVALELFAAAQDALEPLRWRPGAAPEAFGLLAESHSAQGALDRGYLALREYLRRSWREPRAGSLLARHLLRWHDLDGASRELDNASNDRLRRGWAESTLDDLVERWRIRVLRGEWKEAERLAHGIARADDPRAKGLSAFHLAIGSLFAGRSRLALALADESAYWLSRQGLDSGPAARLAADIQLELGDAKGAWQGVAALPRAPNDPSSIVERAIAAAHAARGADAEASRRELANMISTWPGPVARRALARLDGELALVRHDAKAAVVALSQAERLLPARGFCGEHVPIWYGLGRAYGAAGDAEHAESWFRRVAESSSERVCWPIPYARSLAELGRIEAESGRRAEAATSFERFLDLWGDGDLAEVERQRARAFVRAQRAHPAAS